MSAPTLQSRSHHGYSLIELLVVVSIIGFLSAAAFSTYEAGQAKARDAQRFSDMRSIEQALRQFYLDNQRYPDTANDNVSGGGELIGVGNDIDTALAPYMGDVPRDPIHDAGTGNNPTSNALYYYSYDSHHWIADTYCGQNVSNASDRSTGALLSFHRTETYPHDIASRQIDTCHGGDHNMHDAFYNRAFGTELAY